MSSQNVTSNKDAKKNPDFVLLKENFMAFTVGVRPETVPEDARVKGDLSIFHQQGHF